MLVTMILHTKNLVHLFAKIYFFIIIIILTGQCTFTNISNKFYGKGNEHK